MFDLFCLFLPIPHDDGNDDDDDDDDDNDDNDDYDDNDDNDEDMPFFENSNWTMPCNANAVKKILSRIFSVSKSCSNEFLGAMQTP